MVSVEMDGKVVVVEEMEAVEWVKGRGLGGGGFGFGLKWGEGVVVVVVVDGGWWLRGCGWLG